MNYLQLVTFSAIAAIAQATTTTLLLMAQPANAEPPSATILRLSDRAGDLANSFEVPSYARIDAALYYELERFRVALNFKNLSNVRHFEGSQGRTVVNPGAPFTVQGTISWQF